MMDDDNICSVALLNAAEVGDVDAVNAIVRIRPNILDTADEDGYRPIHRASYNDHIEIIDLLIQLGADVRARTSLGWEPLHSAARWGCLAASRRFLLMESVDVNAQTDGGLTALHIAISEGHFNVVDEILQHRCLNRSLKTNLGDTALDILRRNHCAKNARIENYLNELSKE